MRLWWMYTACPPLRYRCMSSQYLSCRSSGRCAYSRHDRLRVRHGGSVSTEAPSIPTPSLTGPFWTTISTFRVKTEDPSLACLMRLRWESPRAAYKESGKTSPLRRHCMSGKITPISEPKKRAWAKSEPNRHTCQVLSAILCNMTESEDRGIEHTHAYCRSILRVSRVVIIKST